MSRVLRIPLAGLPISPTRLLRIGLSVAVFIVTAIVVYGPASQEARDPELVPVNAVVSMPGKAAARLSEARAPAGSLVGLSALAEQTIREPNLRQALARLAAEPQPPKELLSEQGHQRVLRQASDCLKVAAREETDSGMVRVWIGWEGARQQRDWQLAVRLVNVLAEQCAEQCREALEAELRLAAEKAHQAAGQARQQLARLASQVEGMLETCSTVAGKWEELWRASYPASSWAEPGVPPSGQEDATASGQTPAPSEQWAAKNRQLEELQQRREVLLVDRTPLHPEVQQVEWQIAQVQEELAALAARSPEHQPVEQASAPATPPIDPQEFAQAVRALRDKTAQLRAAVEEAERLTGHEAQAAEAMLKRPRIEVHLAHQPGLGQPAATSKRRAWAALIAGLAGAVGVGLIAHGLAIDPPLSTARQVERDLAVPVVAAIPAQAPGTGSKQGQPEAVRAFFWIVSGVLVIVACAVILSRIWSRL